MKHYIFIAILSFVTACKKDYIPNLVAPSYKNTFINTTSKKFLNDFEITCPLDSIAFTDLTKWKEYLQRCVTLDSSSIENIPAGKYSVMIRFEILKTGNAVNPEIVTDPGYGLAEKGLEIFKSYKGKWPLILEEENRSYMHQPITFEIVDE